MPRFLTVMAGAIGVAALIGAMGPPSSAHDGAAGVVAQRMEAMNSLGDAMKRLGAMYRGEVAYDADAVRDASAVIGRHGGAQLTGLFPPGSLSHPSAALPEIWENWERFSALAEELTTRAGTLADAAGHVAKSSDGTPRSTAEFARLGRVCRACHTAFRKED